MRNTVAAFLARTQRFEQSEAEVAAILRDKFRYEPEAGHFYIRSGRYAGKHAGWKNNYGYWALWFFNRPSMAHRLAWLYVHGEMPKGLIDHINRCKTDNRIANLRVVDFRENAANTDINPVHRRAAGITYRPNRSRPWTVRICVRGEKITVGFFETEEAARQAYLIAATVAFGPNARCELADGLCNETAL